MGLSYIKEQQEDGRDSSCLARTEAGSWTPISRGESPPTQLSPAVGPWEVCPISMRGPWKENEEVAAKCPGLAEEGEREMGQRLYCRSLLLA